MNTGPAPSGVCADALTWNNRSLGFSAFGDYTCSTTGGADCFQDRCRYCKVRLTANSQIYRDCTTPTPAQAPPTTTPPSVTPSLAGNTLNFGDSVQSINGACTKLDSPGDIDAGVVFVTDTRCTTQGLIGCFENTVCRQCRTKYSSRFATYMICDDMLADINQPVSMPSGACADSVSMKSRSLGVSAFSDYTCSTFGGSNCFQGRCRYCKLRLTTRSQMYSACPGTIAAPTSPMQATSPNGESFGCDTVPDSYTAAGLTTAYDVSCTSDDYTCFSDQCRICKFRAVDPMFEGYDDCSSIASAAMPPPIPVAVKMAAIDEDSGSFEAATVGPFEYVGAGAAAVGVVAIVTMVVLGAKRTVNKLHSTLRAAN